MPDAAKYDLPSELWLILVRRDADDAWTPILAVDCSGDPFLACRSEQDAREAMDSQSALYDIDPENLCVQRWV